MKTYFNTNAFVGEADLSKIEITKDPAQAELAVMGAKNLDFDQFPKLKAVYRFGIGSENIPRELLKKRGIEVFFPSERSLTILFEATASFTAWLVYYMLFNPSSGDADKWVKKARRFEGNLKLLVVGCGQIGKKVINKLSPLLQVTPFDALTHRMEDLKPLVSQADVISLHIPGTKENQGFFGPDLVSAMKNDAVLINTARGSIVDENALFQKLKETECRAAFDVFWEEPYKGRLKDLGPGKFFMTPHTASNTKDFILSAFDDILSLIHHFKN